MCTGAEIGLILAAAGTATGAANQQAALRAQDRQAARGIKRQSDLRRQAGARAGEQVESFRESGPDEARAEALASFQNALRQAQSQADDSFFEAGAADPRFAEDVAARQQALQGEMQNTAGRLASIDAPQYQRRDEQAEMGRTQSDLGRLADQSQAEDFLTRMRVASRRENPWVSGISQLMQAAGSAMALAPAGASAATTAGAPTTAAAAAPGGMTADTLTKLSQANNPFLNPQKIRALYPGGF